MNKEFGECIIIGIDIVDLIGIEYGSSFNKMIIIWKSI